MKDSPELLNKKDVRALMIFGYAHNEFYHHLKKAGFDVSREFPASPIVFPYMDEINKRLKHNKPVTDYMYAKHLLESILCEKSKKIFPSIDRSVDLIIVGRNMVDKFSYEEIREVFSHLKDEDFSAYLKTVLEKKGLLPIKKKSA